MCAVDLDMCIGRSYFHFSDVDFFQVYSACTTSSQGMESGMQLVKLQGKVRATRGFKLTININMFVKSSFIFCRFENLGLKNSSLILYIGGNTNGKDGISLMKACPTWYIFILIHC